MQIEERNFLMIVYNVLLFLIPSIWIFKGGYNLKVYLRCQFIDS